jgi:catechol 2,3-dioxygenase-like lactoylglutathione lyase family enzyme
MSLFRSLAVFLIATFPAVAQIGSQNAQGVAFGHIHVNSADPDTAIAFWKDLIGAATYSHESLNGVSTLGAIILFTKKDPSGPSAGSTIDHIALKVPDLTPFVEKLKKTSYKSFQPVPGGDRLTIDGPDGVRIELTEDSSMYAPLEFDHIHFRSTKPRDMQAWYAKTFGARSGTGDQSDSSVISGASLTFEQADSPAPSAGRAIDHIGFEVKGLEAFCKKLADDGIKLDSPYRTVPQIKLSIAFLTDPWGTRIELTEGLLAH